MEQRPTDLAKTHVEALEESGNENKNSVETGWIGARYS
jgi:hypothetical protein